MKKLVAFDLDGTLALSKQPLDDDMAGRLADLLDVCLVDIISGGDWPQFEKQVVSRLPERAKLANLFIQPTTGTKLYRWSGDPDKAPQVIPGINLDNLNPEALFFDAIDTYILSDDGKEPIDAQSCEDLPRPQRRFREVRLSPTP